jgi:DNA-binding MarR family transcriptional regulator
VSSYTQAGAGDPRWLARKLIEDRCRRNYLFGEQLFGEPAWDMLLALYGRNDRQELSDMVWLADAAHIPQSTAVRWQWALIERGLVEFAPKRAFGVAAEVRLTEQGRQLMERYLLQTWFGSQGPPCGSTAEND